MALQYVYKSFKANVRVFDGKSGHGLHSLPQALRHHLSAWQTSHSSSMWQSQFGLGTQTANQTKFISPILSPGQPRPLSLLGSVKALSLTSKSLALAYYPYKSPICALFRAQPGDPDQSQISLFWPIRGQLIRTNHRTTHQTHRPNSKAVTWNWESSR